MGRQYDNLASQIHAYVKNHPEIEAKYDEVINAGFEHIDNVVMEESISKEKASAFVNKIKALNKELTPSLRLPEKEEEGVKYLMSIYHERSR